MANNSDRWYFTKEQLDNTPSRKAGYESYKELSYRQQTANFIQDMGQRLRVSQLCINTAIVYMHRFYVFHSFTNFPWHQMAAAALFLAAKVEEQPRKLEYVIKVANMCRNNKDTNIDVNSERYQAQSQDLVFNENVLLQTLGFDVAIDHPHTHVVRCCHLVRASKDLAQSSYFLASNSLHLTTMCLQYKPTVVACFCIHLACKWSHWEIPLSTEKKEWFLYVDPTVTAELLQQLTQEFLSIFESCPSRLKEKIMAIGDNGMHNNTNAILNSPFDTDPKKIVNSSDQKDSHSHRPHDKGLDLESHNKHRVISQQQREREYREKKEREREREREKLASQQQQPHGVKQLASSSQSNEQRISSHGHNHHRSGSSSSSSSSSIPSGNQIDPKLKQHSSSSSSSRQQQQSSSNRNVEPRGILREATRDSKFLLGTKEYRDGTNTTLSSSGGSGSSGSSGSSSSNSNNNNHSHSTNSSSNNNTKELTLREHRERSDRGDINKIGDITTNNIKNYSDTNRLNNYNGDNKRTSSSSSSSGSNVDENRSSSRSISSLDPNKSRRHDEKTYLKPDTNNDNKKHSSANNNHYHDNRNTSGYVNKSSSSLLPPPPPPSSSSSLNSTSLKTKSPFVIDNNTSIKSVPSKSSSSSSAVNAALQQTSLSSSSGLSRQQQQQQHNGNNSFGSLPLLEPTKDEITLKDELPPTTNVKRPSLFSPQPSSPEILKRPSSPLHMNLNIKQQHQQELIKQQQQQPNNFDLLPLSPLNSPEDLGGLTNSNNNTPLPSTRRSRNYSSGSEPELRPVMKKIDQVQGFENLMRDSTIGINKLAQVPDIITPITDKEKEREKKLDPVLTYSKEMKPPDIIPPLSSSSTSTTSNMEHNLINNNNNSSSSNSNNNNNNNNSHHHHHHHHQQQQQQQQQFQHSVINGIETNPMLISNLLKEAPLMPQLPVVNPATAGSDSGLTTATQSTTAFVDNNKSINEPLITTISTKDSSSKEKEHHHHKSKKKNKEKHKHKDKDRNREEKEKKKKHKDKDKDKHKEKHSSKHDTGIDVTTNQSTVVAPRIEEPIKLKISKDKIQPILPIPSTPPTTTTTTSKPSGITLKIKVGGSDHHTITASTYNNSSSSSSSSHNHSSSSSRKRERDRNSSGDGPSAKMSRSNSHHHHHKEAKQNGRHSYNKVTQLGDGDTSVHRLVDSKYINKNSSS